ncbi:MAG: sulfate ABC transporter substrate-binding protein [Opitutaceae bacterium]|nr:sulfate ABC transporter substrate-binding protein [Opitutaceae bacterium]
MTDIAQGIASANGLLAASRLRAAIMLGAFALVALVAFAALHRARTAGHLLVVAYDGSREYAEEVNHALAAKGWRFGATRVVHDGSVQQVANLLRGIPGDVALLSSPADIDAVARKRTVIRPSVVLPQIREDSPNHTTIVFLVRAGNPKHIGDWQDLRRREISVLIPDPSVSGAGRMAYLACVAEGQGWSGAPGGQRDPALAWAVFTRARLLRMGARRAMQVFLECKDADVLLTWENEAHRAAQAAGSNLVEVVYPTRSLRAEPVAAVIGGQADGSEVGEPARAWLEFLHSAQGQEVAARVFLRPNDRSGIPMHRSLRDIELIPVSAVFENWTSAWAQHFEAGGTFSVIEEARLALHGGRE